MVEYDFRGSGEERLEAYKGFSARVFQRDGSNEIVISYAGTQDTDIKDWVHGNFDMTLGVGSEHGIRAAYLYQKVKQDHPDAQISFTGHSLGGGLASVMGVWFDKPAYGFDPAPFKQAA